MTPSSSEAVLHQHDRCAVGVQHLGDRVHHVLEDRPEVQLARQPVADVEQSLGVLPLLMQLLRVLGDPQVRVDPRRDLAEVERLADVVVGAGVEGLLEGVLSGARGEHDHLEAAGRLLGPEPLQHLEPVDVGHHQVEEQQVGPERADLVEGVLSVLRRRDLVAVLGERLREHLADEPLVVCDEDLLSHAARYYARRTKAATACW
jgi:hypothetical protein